jgi:cysteine desulfurase
MSLDRIYFDNNATTFCAPEVIDAMADIARQPLANPASQHTFGRSARKVLEQAAADLLASVNARSHGMSADRILFCSGGTEANNLAVLGLPQKCEGAILVSAIEHPSVLAAAEAAAQRGKSVEYIPCTPSGVVDVDWLRDRLSRATQSPVALVAVMAANNETGVLQPISQIAAMVKEARARFHVDAVQCLGKSSVDFQAYQADSMTICAHKLHGPVGIGALVHRAEMKFDAQIFGGLQQAAVRSGTESVMLPVGFACAVKRVADNPERLVQMKALRDRFEQMLLYSCNEHHFRIELIGASESRLPNTSCVAFAPHSRQALQMALDLAGLACSTGSACESGSATPSHVLLAMGLSEPIVQSAVRFSLSEQTTQADVDQAVSIITKCLLRMNKK